MKKRIVLVVSVLVVVAVAFGIWFFTNRSGEALPDASGDPQVTLSWGGTAAAEDLASIAMQRVADLVEERTGGSLKINVFPASQLGSAMTQMEMVMSGNIDMFMEGSNYMSDWGVPERNIASMYFQCPSMEAFKKVLASDLYKSWEDKFFETSGLRTLASNWVRPPVEIASNVPLRTFEDFKNLKLRSLPSEFTLAALRSLGTNPTSVSYNEVYLALQQGVIDATIATLDAVYKMNFYQVSKYLIKVDAAYINFAVWINEDKFQSLSPAQQEILLATCKEVGDWYTQAVDEELEGYVEKMVEHGIEVITYSQEERAKFAAATKKLIDQYEEEGKWRKGLYDEYVAIMEE